MEALDGTREDADSDKSARSTPDPPSARNRAASPPGSSVARAAYSRPDGE